MMHQTHHPTVEFRRKMIAMQLESMGKARSDWKIWLHGAIAGFLFGVIAGMCVIAQVI
jgi:hypothetical protein